MHFANASGRGHTLQAFGVVLSFRGMWRAHGAFMAGPNYVIGSEWEVPRN